MIKVLHVLDIAGVPSIISHFFNKFKKGQSDIIYFRKKSFSNSISKFYEGKSFENFRELIFFGVPKSFHYDIIHIHGAENLIPLFKFSCKKIVLHYHGSDINIKSRSLSKKRIFCRSMADLIIYNGKKMEPNIVTLKKIRKEYLPNPIDVDLFTPKPTKRHGELILVSKNLDKKKTISFVQKFKNIQIIDLDIQQIPYRNMPNILSKFETYVDVKIMPWGTILPDLSTTALQALACGCKVYHDGKMIKDFPKEHHPYNVIEKLDSFYKELFK